MKKLALALLLFTSTTFLAQETDFARLLKDPNATLQQKQAAFEAYWQTHDRKEKGKGWKAFKRSEYMMRHRADQNGYEANPLMVYEEAVKARKQYEVSGKQLNGIQATPTWQYIGPPNGVPSNGGAGRLCFITFDPANAANIWVGSPGGGLWKSTNGGSSWTVVNDKLPNLGAAHLAIDPTNSNVMYLSTGDRDASDTYSIGLLKSTDGGLTWNTTGLIYTPSQMVHVNCVLIDPTNTQRLFAATSNGIFRSMDGGVNWLNLKSGDYKDIKFKPGNVNTILAAGNSFARSTNGGATWTNPTFPTPNNNSVGRVAVAVTPADTSLVYVLAGQGATGSYGFAGFYKSTNAGASFTKVCSSPNLLGWDPNGNDSGGQAWYDLVVAANPTDANEVICGGVNTWQSTDGGNTFNLFTHWYGGGAPYVHADVHAIEYGPGNPNNIYIGCDGGIFASTNAGASWSMISNGLQIGQMYRLGVSQSNPSLTLTGWQDNGTSLDDIGNTSYDNVLGGDGMECAIDPVNDQVLYAEYYYGYIEKSVSGPGGFFPIVTSGGTGVDEDGDWVTPYIIDPSNPSVMYVGKTEVYKSTNGGLSFSAASSFGTATRLIAMAVAPSNGNYVYAATSSAMYMTSNGSAFTQVAAPGGPIAYICVDPQNAQRVWAVLGGYAPGNKVFYSSNGGTSWSNISGNLPNVPVNCIAYGPGSNDGLYVGTDIGVYYKDNSLSNWIFYSNGLPNVIINELEFQESTQKLRAATYGRGLWEVDAYSAPTSAPVAAFSANSTTVCVGTTVNFYDNSTNLPSTWNWTLSGGSPASSSLQSPSATYTAVGTYPVKLVVSNSAGSDSLTSTNYVTVLPLPVITTTSDTTICRGDSAQLCAYGGVQYQWLPVTGLPNYNSQCPKAAPISNKTYTVTAYDANGCKGTAKVVISVIPFPQTPTVYAITDSLCANPASGVTYQWYYNGSPMTGDTNRCVHITQNGTYSVVITDTSVCQHTKTSNGFNVTNIGIGSPVSDAGIAVFPNPARDVLSFRFSLSEVYQVRLYTAVGTLVFDQEILASPNRVYSANLALPAGVYLVDIADRAKKSVYTRKLIIVE
jgi:PKD repeat protein